MSSKIDPITAGMCKVDKRLNRWKKVEKAEGQGKKKTHFRLLNLPQLAFVEVMKLMSYTDQIKFSLATKKMKEYVKLARVNAKTCTLIVADYDTRIALDGTKTIICNSWLSPQENPGLLNIRDLIPYQSDFVESACFGVQYLQNIFIWKSLKIEFCLGNMKNTNIEEELKTVASLNFDCITLKGGAIDKTNLDLIMETAICESKKFGRSIKIIRTTVPNNYEHENAFKFRNVYYDNAQWVRPKQLRSLRDINEVTLGMNNFTPEDFHAFIKYWVICTDDLATVLTINTNRTLSSEQLFLDIVHAKTFRSGQSFYLICSHSSILERKHRLLVVQIDPGKVIFNACDEQEPISISINGHQQKVCFKREFWVFQRFKRKTKCTNQLKEIETKLRNAKSKEERETLQVRKLYIEEEIEDCNKKLENHKFRYSNNILTIDEVLSP